MREDMHHRPIASAAVEERPPLKPIGEDEASLDEKLHMDEKLLFWSPARMRRRFFLMVAFGVMPFFLRYFFFGEAFPFDKIADLAAGQGSETDLPKLPNVLVMGAQESGTRSTASWIFRHNNVCKPMSPADGKTIKEVHFFDKDERFLQDLEFYANHYAHCGSESLVLDATPDYLQHAYRVHETYSKLSGTAADDLKIVMVLRNPADRELAWYTKLAAEFDSHDPPIYVRTILDEKGQLMNFEDYTHNYVLPRVRYSTASYAKWIRKWLEFFDRDQILIISHDELMSDPEAVSERLRSFLDLKMDKKLRNKVFLQETDVDEELSFPSCEVETILSEAFAPANGDLYDLLEETHGPEEEQRPFQEFKLPSCVPRKDRMPYKPPSKRKKPKKQTESASESTPDKLVKKKVEDPKTRTTVFFAAHHKTGTTLSQLVAKRLANQGLVNFAEEGMDEQALEKNWEGKSLQCRGTREKPDIRSYLHWPQWMIAKLWSHCIETWWENWPSLSSRTDQLIEKCGDSGMNLLMDELRKVNCKKNYQVVHFVRSPIDIILSSYRYTKKGEEQWMHDKLEDHPRFTPRLCGDHSCQHMSITEAVNELPVCVGLLLEMRLVSLEIVKQMLVAATLARADPEHHITVNLSEIMKSSTGFHNVWTRTLRDMFPEKTQESLAPVVESLKEFDTGTILDRSSEASETESMEQMQCLFEDAEVRLMMNDPVVKLIMQF